MSSLIIRLFRNFYLVALAGAFAFCPAPSMALAWSADLLSPRVEVVPQLLRLFGKLRGQVVFLAQVFSQVEQLNSPSSKNSCNFQSPVRIAPAGVVRQPESPAPDSQKMPIQ